jgi:hypothetical protein
MSGAPYRVPVHDVRQAPGDAADAAAAEGPTRPVRVRNLAGLKGGRLCPAS